MEARTDSPASRAWLGVALGLWVLLAEAWFQGPFLGGWAGAAVTDAAALGLALAVVFHLRGALKARPRIDRAFVALIAGLLLLATVVRLPALSAPGGLISSDSAVAGIIAQELRDGVRPAPIYAPGFPYEGTLKPHLTALLGALFRRSGTPFLYALSSHLFYMVWIVAVAVLAHRAAGRVAAAGAGLFMAVSPRFLTAFSLNNVGQYPEVNALGAIALVLLTRGPDLLLVGFVLGLALWQHLLGIYFVIVVAFAVLLTPQLRRLRSLAAGLAGFACGSYPVWIWNAAHGWATFDWIRRGGKSPADRLGGVPDRLETVATVSFPKLFGLTDIGAPEAVATVLGLLLPALVVWMAWTHRGELARIRGRSPILLALVLLVVVLGLFSVSKFSHRGAQRPRYLLPLYTSVALAAGVALADLNRRSRFAAVAAAAAVLGVNAAGLVPWMSARSDAEARDRAFVQALLDQGIATAYAGFWVAPKYTFLAQGKVILSGELGPDVSWVHAGQAARVRETGPDAFIVGSEDLAGALGARLEALGCTFERTEMEGHLVFHHLSKRVSLEDVSGYDADLLPGSAGAAGPPE